MVTEIWWWRDGDGVIVRRWMDMVDMDMVDMDMVNMDMDMDMVEYFSEVNIFQGWIFFRGEYFQEWIFFMDEYFLGVNIFQW